MWGARTRAVLVHRVTRVGGASSAWGLPLSTGAFPVEDPWRPPEMPKVSLTVDWEWGTMSGSPGAHVTLWPQSSQQARRIQ